MNVISLNTAAKASANNAIEGGTQAAPEDRENPSAFANALKDQEALLKDDPKDKVEQAIAQQAIEKQPVDAEQETNEANDGQVLAALLEKFLPPLTENNADQTAAADIGSALPITTTETPVMPTDNPLPAAILTPQDTGGIRPTATPDYPKPLPENVALKTPRESAAASVALPKMPALSQTQASPGFALPTTDNTESFKQALSAQSVGEQKMPETITDMMPLPKPVETRVENLTIARPMSQAGWGKDLGEHILWLANKEITAAEIKLNPAHLGPISVRIDVTQDNQTSILFAAQHAETKEALEAALPKLKEMLQSQQINLVNVNISQNPGSNQGHAPAKPFVGVPGSQDGSPLDADPNALAVTENDAVIGKGLLSLYA